MWQNLRIRRATYPSLPASLLLLFLRPPCVVLPSVNPRVRMRVLHTHVRRLRTYIAQNSPNEETRLQLQVHAGGKKPYLAFSGSWTETFAILKHGTKNLHSQNYGKRARRKRGSSCGKKGRVAAALSVFASGGPALPARCSFVKRGDDARRGKRHFVCECNVALHCSSRQTDRGKGGKEGRNYISSMLGH